MRERYLSVAKSDEISNAFPYVPIHSDFSKLLVGIFIRCSTKLRQIAQKFGHQFTPNNPKESIQSTKFVGNFRSKLFDHSVFDLSVS